MPSVINRHRFLPTPGVGPNVPPRTGKERRAELPEPWVYVGRGSPLGNPFSRAQYGEEALGLYRRWLFDRIRANDRRVMLQLRSIGESTHLVCSCAPKPCHADVVARAWAWALEKRLVP